MSTLAQSIHKTLAFFDAQDFPLTLPEIRNYLVKEPSGLAGSSLSEIKKVLDTQLSNLAARKTGLYFLAGRQELVERRLANYRISLKRFIKIRRYLRPLRYFPYLRAVAVSGSQALSHGEQASDIDLFVITSKDRIWLARALVSFYFQILGQRRHGKHISDRFCLNHYVCEGHELAEDRNLYTAVEYASLIPVLGREQLEEFWRGNSWIGKFLHNPRFQKQNHFFKFEFSALRKVFEAALDFTIAPFLNWLLGLYQKRRIKRREYILVSNSELSFHPGSRGQQILAKFSAKIGG
ncbi:MAG: hypothetical protein U1C57_03205 [Candidatus Doudnabacteria bacterium]|nr:hypothetical protein [bacterium]MDZ4244084.1 hypothetical protein [Candidatus Doudnabacteria bacterium]